MKVIINNINNFTSKEVLVDIINFIFTQTTTNSFTKDTVVNIDNEYEVIVKTNKNEVKELIFNILN